MLSVTPIPVGRRSVRNLAISSIESGLDRLPDKHEEFVLVELRIWPALLGRHKHATPVGTHRKEKVTIDC